ncbi:MAG: hypothetical protein VE96_C0004G0026, partial [candidate division Kazan bacterium GW2011_GWA1_44_22]
MPSVTPMNLKERHQPKNVNAIHKKQFGLQDKIA